MTGDVVLFRRLFSQARPYWPHVAALFLLSLLSSPLARLFRHVQRLSLAYHDARGTSDSTYRIQHDATAIQYVLIESVIPFISATVTLVGMIYVMTRIDWQLALIALAISPGLVVTGRI